MQLTKCLLLLIFVAWRLNILAQVRWNGLGGDGQWFNPANWISNTVPGAGDDVILDNSFVPGSYVVSLPAGNLSVTVRSLTITPAAGGTIEVVLPESNTALPGFLCNRSPYGLVINKGGIFRNASGGGVGSTLSIADSLFISNGGRYIHNTSRAHAYIIDLLSKAPGTETGIFELDMRSGGSFISFSGNTFGTLMLSATAAGGVRTYNANGVNRAIIRGDFLLNNGISFNLSLDDTVFIAGNYEQKGGTFNLGSAPYNTVVVIGRHFIQSAGTITENNDGFPVIEMKGTSPQYITAAGSINNSVTFKINNPTGIVLQTPLSLPYSLELVNGQVTTSAANLLTLQAGCSVKADTLSPGSFINGPLKKQGLAAADQFLFPVGKGNAQRWLALTHATGNYTVEFFRANPRLMNNTYQAGLHHISAIEYWTITADPLPLPQAQVKLSFNDPNSGGVTDITALRVAQLSGSMWANAGNTEYGGTAGSNGFVTSHPINPFGSATQYFTLASTSASFNPLLLNQRSRTVPDPTLAITGILSPTVTSSFTRLMLTVKKKTSIQLMITDGTGRVVKIIPAYLQKGSNALFINASLFPAGIYTITVSGQEKMMQPVRFIRL